MSRCAVATAAAICTQCRGRCAHGTARLHFLGRSCEVKHIASYVSYDSTLGRAATALVDRVSGMQCVCMEICDSVNLWHL